MGRILVLALLILVGVVPPTSAADGDWPSTHPCTGDKIPLTTEKAVVMAVECLYRGRVAKVSLRRDGDTSYYEFRVLTADGRVRSVAIDPNTGLPLIQQELQAVYEALDR